MSVRIAGLHKRYRNGQQALNGIDLNVSEGEFFGLLGPNGSGKTTLISILSALFPPTAGQVEICGHPAGRPEVKRCIGLVPQASALYPTLSLIENLEFFAAMHGLTGAERQSRIDYCIGVARLENFANRPVASYSGGMRQRANIVTALLHRPRLLLLDEPTVGVDPQSRNMIFDCLRTLNAEGVTMIYTTHYMEEAEQLCSRLAILNEGKVIAEGERTALMAERSHCRNLAELFLDLTGRELRD